MRRKLSSARGILFPVLLLSATGGTAEAEKPSVEVLYEGPTAAGGVVSPKDIMLKELSDAGLAVLLPGGPTSEALRAESPTAEPTQPAAVPTPAQPPETSRPEPAIGISPSGLTVKQIFDFVRSVQQGKQAPRTQPPARFQFIPGPALAFPPATSAHVVVAMRASLRRIREFQGIYSTEAHMQIGAVTAKRGRIQALLAAMGPEKSRGFGNDWEQAEESALREISALMCPAFAKKLRQKLVEEE